MSLDLTVIIPTYKEEEIIAPTLYEINSILKRTDISFEILIVDDNSPDKTGKIVQEVSAFFPVRLITRTADPGLSQSVIEGFAQARGDVIVVTDADQSHDLLLIPEMYRECKTHDIVNGSRYMKGGHIKDWPFKRRIISLGATFLARLLFPSVTDPVSGFFAVKRNLVSHASLTPCGYKILLEVLGKSCWHTIKELPYTFQNRAYGESKLKTKTIIDFVRHLWSIAHFPGRAREEIRKMKMFAVVGISGIFVNTIALAMFKEWFGFPLLGASFVAIELSIVSNFLLNDRLTFKDNKTHNPWLHRLLSFNGISIGGMIINMSSLMLLSFLGVYYLIANLASVPIGFLWNFLWNRKITWGVKK
jgi:dolichol-phosphate mannosyltransferase